MVREMLEQLRHDFELVLYSSQSKEYTKKVAEILTLNPTDYYKCVFHHVLTKEECIYNDELDQHISDLEVLTENRNLKDIIFVTDNF
jgi:TFIIF-interacting CTD phosphatase-like protein